MTERMKIIKYPAPILRQIAIKVELTEFNQYQNLIKDMIEITKLHGGQGLAAPQINVSRRVIVYRDEKKNFNALINPVIIASSGKIISLKEGCLSIPNICRDIKRARYVTVEGLDEKGNPVAIYAKTTMSIILQHEIDHLNGVTILQGRRKYRLNNSKDGGNIG